MVAINSVFSTGAKFDVSNHKSIAEKLIDSASKDARNKAEKMAKSLVTEIKSVFAISESADFNPYFNAFGIKERNVSADLYRNNAQHMMMFVPKRINIKQSVNVVFLIK